MRILTQVLQALGFSALLLAGCGGGGGNDPAPAATPIPAPPTPTTPAVATANADISLLMMGNSHTSVNDLPETLAAMVRTARPGKTVAVAVAPGYMFLEERIGNAATVALMRGQRWTFVILQAQKYSTSGQFSYSTAEAEELIRISRQQGAVPVMFPEWPRRGVAETARIYDLHTSIAAKEPACVAPIGQAWDQALARYPSIVLHHIDGNHSAPAGAYLTALILYATLTGNSPTGVPDLPVAGVDSGTQGQLRAIAAETVNAVSPRIGCPNDAI